MAQYQIPEQFLLGFKHLLLLEASEIESIADALRKLPVGTGPQKLVTFIEVEAPHENIRTIARSIFSMGNLLAASDSDITDIAEGLSTSYFKQSKDDNKDLQQKLTSIILKLLEAGKNLKITFKAFNLISSYERIFRRAKFISDIRLIFNDDLKDDSRHAIVMHQLKLDYHVNDDTDEFFLTLETKELYKLREQIDRAIEKDSMIKKGYQDKINFIEITD